MIVRIERHARIGGMDDRACITGLTQYFSHTCDQLAPSAEYSTRKASTFCDASAQEIRMPELLIGQGCAGVGALGGALAASALTELKFEYPPSFRAAMLYVYRVSATIPAS